MRDGGSSGEEGQRRQRRRRCRGTEGEEGEGACVVGLDGGVVSDRRVVGEIVGSDASSHRGPVRLSRDRSSGRVGECRDAFMELADVDEAGVSRSGEVGSDVVEIASNVRDGRFRERSFGGFHTRRDDAMYAIHDATPAL